jgi:4-hydroxybenzoate polyprenyltransferase
MEEREVTVADPGLSDDANRRLTEELREVVGDDHVQVPVDRVHPSQGERPPPSGLLAFLSTNRILLAITFLVFLTIGAIVSLSTGSWWFLPLAVGVHALGTVTVPAVVLRMTSTAERPSPTAVAMLEEEGIRNPEEHFSKLVAEFTHGEDRSTAEILSSGANERTVAADEDPLTAAKEQQSAMTPSAGPSQPAGEGSLPSAMLWAVVLGLAAISIIIPAASGGGWLWLLSAVILPLAGGWIVLQKTMGRRSDQRPEAALSAKNLPVAIVIGTATAVVLFCAVVALAFQH